jgi:hypothetical protein
MPRVGIQACANGLVEARQCLRASAVIRRDTFHDYFDGLGVRPDATAGVTNETDVYDNLVYNAGDDGSETGGSAATCASGATRFTTCSWASRWRPSTPGRSTRCATRIYRLAGQQRPVYKVARHLVVALRPQ